MIAYLAVAGIGLLIGVVIGSRFHSSLAADLVFAKVKLELVEAKLSVLQLEFDKFEDAAEKDLEAAKTALILRVRSVLKLV